MSYNGQPGAPDTYDGFALHGDGFFVTGENPAAIHRHFVSRLPPSIRRLVWEMNFLRASPDAMEAFSFSKGDGHV